MNIIKKTFFILILISITSCGYEPIFIKNNKNNTPIKDYQIIGDKMIGRKIVSAFNLDSQNKSEGYGLIINTRKTLETIAKDDTGRSSSFKTSIIVLISLMKGDEVYKEKNFSSDFVYNNIKSKFDLKQYQQDIESNLIDIIIDEVSIFLIWN